jgi:hypothetical protein
MRREARRRKAAIAIVDRGPDGARDPAEIATPGAHERPLSTRSGHPSRLLGARRRGAERIGDRLVALVLEHMRCGVFRPELRCAWGLVLALAIPARFALIVADRVGGQCADILVRPLVSVGSRHTVMGIAATDVASVRTDRFRRALGFGGTDRKPCVHLLHALENDAGGGIRVPSGEPRPHWQCNRQ